MRTSFFYCFVKMMFFAFNCNYTVYSLLFFNRCFLSCSRTFLCSSKPSFILFFLTVVVFPIPSVFFQYYLFCFSLYSPSVVIITFKSILSFSFVPVLFKFSSFRIFWQFSFFLRKTRVSSFSSTRSYVFFDCCSLFQSFFRSSFSCCYALIAFCFSFINSCSLIPSGNSFSSKCSFYSFSKCLQPRFSPPIEVF